MSYEKLSREDFDAIVTGELTHLSIWLESQIMTIIADYFLGDSPKKETFSTLLLRRDGLTFQDKIDILRALEPLLGEVAKEVNLISILKRIEEFKSFRNSFAHGMDASEGESLTLVVETVGRSGRPKSITVTPQSHRDTVTETELLLEELKQARLRFATNPSLYLGQPQAIRPDSNIS